MNYQHIKTLLKSKNKTQSQLAEALGRDKSAITLLLQGKRKLKAEEVMLIARFLEVNEAEVLGIHIPTPEIGVENPQFDEPLKIPFQGIPSAVMLQSGQVTEDSGQFYFSDEMAVSDNAFALEVKNRALDLRGFLPGDIIISELNRTPIIGDVVIVQHYNEQTGNAETVLRLYHPPYLKPESTEEEHDILHEERSSVRIVAPVLRLIRLL